MDSAALLCLVKIGGKVIDLLRAIGVPLPSWPGSFVAN